MTESPIQFHCAVIADHLRDAIKTGEIGERDAETITLHLSEVFRLDPRDFDPYEPGGYPPPRTSIWPSALLVAAGACLPIAAVFLLDIGGLR